MNLETPKYDLEQFPEVYEPSEDTFLFLDALEADFTYLLNLDPKIAIEIGSGSGVVITALSQILKSSCSYFATDINPQACLATKSTANLNNSSVECLNMDLLTSFKRQLFDIILFNPPYVVTNIDEVCGNGLNRAWAGGEKGRAITDRLLGDLSNFLTSKGVCYMVILKENNPKEITNMMRGLKFHSQIILERKIPGEHLYIYRFSRIITN